MKDIQIIKYLYKVFIILVVLLALQTNLSKAQNDASINETIKWINEKMELHSPGDYPRKIENKKCSIKFGKYVTDFSTVFAYIFQAKDITKIVTTVSNHDNIKINLISNEENINMRAFERTKEGAKKIEDRFENTVPILLKEESKKQEIPKRMKEAFTHLVSKCGGEIEKETF